MPSTYTTNPLTGRAIRIGGNTFNRLVMESHDFINGGLVLRQNVNLPPEPPQYLNTITGRMVRHGTRTYFQLFEAGYDLVEDYYLVAPGEPELNDLIYELATRWTRRLTFHEIDSLRTDINYSADLRDTADRVLAELLENEGTPRPQTLEAHAPRLAELNVALCRECLMPENPNDLTDGLCKDCNT
jgi:hypothetical protein